MLASKPRLRSSPRFTNCGFAKPEDGAIARCTIASCVARLKKVNCAPIRPSRSPASKPTSTSELRSGPRSALPGLSGLSPGTTAPSRASRTTPYVRSAAYCRGDWLAVPQAKRSRRSLTSAGSTFHAGRSLTTSEVLRLGDQMAGSFAPSALLSSTRSAPVTNR